MRSGGDVEEDICGRRRQHFHDILNYESEDTSSGVKRPTDWFVSQEMLHHGKTEEIELLLELKKIVATAPRHKEHFSNRDLGNGPPGLGF